jgi:hypothetical protein
MMKDGSSSRGGGLGRKDGRGTKRGREEVRLFFKTNLSHGVFSGGANVIFIKGRYQQEAGDETQCPRGAESTACR